MSYWVYLEHPIDHGPLNVDQHSEGGTYVLGGTIDAELNVTYNYSVHIRSAMHPDGLRFLHERQAAEAIPFLERAVASLGTERDPDYWAPTAGNAGYALNILLTWARKHPDGVFRVS